MEIRAGEIQNAQPRAFELTLEMREALGGALGSKTDAILKRHQSCLPVTSLCLSLPLLLDSHKTLAR